MIGKGITQFIKVPWKITNVVVFSLEKFGEGIEATPDLLFRESKPSKEKSKAPGDVASGLARGT